MNKYLNPVSYTRRMLDLANQYLFPYAEAFLAPRIEAKLRHPPVFILGPPRCGSTLAFQVITDALNVGYISNSHAVLYGAPALVERLFSPGRNRPMSDYRSQFGNTEGIYAPSECGDWWYRFFRRTPAYVKLDEVDPSEMALFRRSVAAMVSCFDRPVLFKNLYASLRIQAVAHYLPESLYIVIHRNEINNAHSILEARYKQFKNYKEWFSVEPPGIERLKQMPTHQQVIEQIREINKIIDLDLRKIGVDASRCFNLIYEDFCSNPRTVINRLQSFLHLHGCDVEKRSEVPAFFHQRRDVRIDRRLYDDMVRYAKNTDY